MESRPNWVEPPAFRVAILIIDKRVIGLHRLCYSIARNKPFVKRKSLKNGMIWEIY